MKISYHEAKGGAFVLKLAAVITCHNRKDVTVTGITSLLQCTLPESTELALYATDDGCTDGTGAALRELCPAAVITVADGNRYWSGGMKLSMQKAMDAGADYILWLNDDVILHSDSILNAFEVLTHHGENTIAVGTTTDGAIQPRITYGGLKRRSLLRATKFDLIDKLSKGRPDTMHGQFVLIPRAVAEKVGLIDDAFKHTMADFDYGLRARKLGIELVLIEHPVGICRKNLAKGDWKRPSRDFASFWAKVNSPHGMPVKERYEFCKRHGGPFWLFHSAWPYVLPILNQLATSAIFQEPDSKKDRRP